MFELHIFGMKMLKTPFRKNGILTKVSSPYFLASLRHSYATESDKTSHKIKRRHMLANLNMCRCVNLLMCSSVCILFNVEYFKTDMRQLSDEVRNQIIGQLQAGRQIIDVAQYFNICKKTFVRL